MILDNEEFINRLREAILAKLEVPAPYRLVIETDVGQTWAMLRDDDQGVNRFAVDLGIVRDNEIADAADRAIQELRQQLQEQAGDAEGTADEPNSA